MQKDERKKQIITLIESGKEIQLTDILEKGDSFEKRTLIRDLNELLAQNVISKRISGRIHSIA